MSPKKKRRLIMRTVILAILGLAIVYTLYSNFTKDDRGKIAKGDKAPNFILQDMEGNQHKLSEYEGQGVFLNFWGTWCKPCEKEMPYMNNQYKVYHDQGVEILAVNVGESDYAVNKFVKKHKLDFPVLIDKNKEVMNAYGISPLPTTMLIDPNGNITKIITGEMTEEDIQKYMEAIKP